MPPSLQEKSLDMAWDLLTRVYGLPKERMYVTYFGGNEKLGLPPDLEARDVWLKLGWVCEGNGEEGGGVGGGGRREARGKRREAGGKRREGHGRREGERERR